MASRLSQAVIAARLIEWRNLKNILHPKAKERIRLLGEKNRQLREENERLQKQVQEVQKELRKKEENLEKLRKLLFERQQPRHRTHRTRPKKRREKDSYRRPAPDHIDERKTVSPVECDTCYGPLSEVQSFRTRLIEDIVLNPKTFVTEWTVTRHWCNNCKKLVEAPMPGVLPRAALGPQTLTLVVLYRYRFNLPYAKIQDLLKMSYGLAISEGEIARLLTEARTLTGDTWVLIEEGVRQGKRVHCDETGWYVNGVKVWVHVFSSEDATLYVIHDTRGKGVAEKALGEAFEGIRITDCLPNYKNLPGEHQICWAHHTREAGENVERDKESHERQKLKRVLDAIYARLRTETDNWHAERAKTAHQWCEQKTSRLLVQSWHDPPSKKLVERLRTFRSALFTCLAHPDIPPDNNEAERCLRKLVVQRKIWGGNRSWKHAAIHAQMMSVLETLKKEGNETLAGLQELLSAGIQKRLSCQ